MDLAGPNLCLKEVLDRLLIPGIKARIEMDYTRRGSKREGAENVCIWGIMADRAGNKNDVARSERAAGSFEKSRYRQVGPRM